jgi:hypothetical protein
VVVGCFKQAKAVNMVRELFATLIAMSMLHVAYSATYYIDYENGRDSNNGNTKASPWKHCPGMQPFNSTTYKHAAGDQFIFKGGVTWPHAALPMQVTVGGTPQARDYYGVDKSWYKGAIWAR